MFNLAIFVLKGVLLAALYLFLLAVLWTVRADLAPRSGSRPRLVALKGAVARGASFPLSGEVVIGRDSEEGISLPDPYVSSRHARVFADGDCFFIEDLGSTNGVYVNGRRLREAARLRPGDRIKLGETIFQFVERT